MKKLFKYLVCLTLLLAIAGCTGGSSDESDSVKILCPTGAPSLAFVSEYENITKEGKIDFVDGSDQLVAELSKDDSEYDIIVAPINLGANLISNKQTDYKIQAVITWGNLYLVGTSEDALNGSGELALFGEGAVPQLIVEATNLETSLTPTYYQSATLVQQQLLAGNVQAGLLAEPLASATIAKAKQNGIELSIIKNMQEAYGKDGYPQAAIFVKDGKNFDSLFEKIDEFTNNGYEGLKDYLEKIGIETLGLPSVEITVNSIERQNLHYKLASDCSKQIKDFLELYKIEYSDDMLV
ncbi:hypothetical protein [Thomasclavelia sp.]|uniref:hypothetical protein n=1 Tax=Thomasclavelia sp. TaxID=3025757 RepID=UPI0025CC5921|nr:hypothetical protein [Thomasclavelia sp.]